MTGTGNGNGNGNAYDRGDYNSSFALRAVELKMVKKITNTEKNSFQIHVKIGTRIG